MKKEEENLFTTSLPNTKSLLTFVIAIFILLALFFIFKSYSSLVGEKTIEIKSDTDLSVAKEKLQEQVATLQKDTGELRALVT